MKIRNLNDLVDKEIRITGHLNMGMPFLGKTIKGNLYTPSFYIDDNLKIQNIYSSIDPNFYTYRNGREEIFTKSNNTIDNKNKIYKSLAISKKIYDDKEEKDNWFNLRAWGHIAKDIHLNFDKGDLVNVRIVPNYDMNNNKIWDIIEITLINKA